MMSSNRPNYRTRSFRNWSAEGKTSNRTSTQLESQEKLKAAAVWLSPIKWMTSLETSLAKILGTKKSSTCYLLVTTWASRLTLFWEESKVISILSMKLKGKGRSKHNLRRSSDDTFRNAQVEVLSLLGHRRRFPPRRLRFLKSTRQARLQMSVRMSLMRLLLRPQ